MSLPQFTNREQYVVSYIKAANGTPWNHYMWSYMVGGALLAAFGAYLNLMPMIISAFVVVYGFRIYEEWYQANSVSVWKSIIAKYEAAILQPSDAPGANE